MPFLQIELNHLLIFLVLMSFNLGPRFFVIVIYDTIACLLFLCYGSRIMFTQMHPLHTTLFKDAVMQRLLLKPKSAGWLLFWMCRNSNTCNETLSQSDTNAK